MTSSEREHNINSVPLGFGIIILFLALLIRFFGGIKNRASRVFGDG